MSVLVQTVHYKLIKCFPIILRSILFLSILIINNIYADSYIVGNKTNQFIQDLNNNDLIAIFTFRKSKWPNGENIIIISFKPNTFPFTYFSQNILNIESFILSNVWNRYIFSGSNITPPIIVHSRDELLQILKTNKWAIGYVLSNSLDEYSFKIIN